MSKNKDFVNALAYLKNKLKVGTLDSVMGVLKREGLELSPESLRLLELEVNDSVERNVNDSHVAFKPLLD